MGLPVIDLMLYDGGSIGGPVAAELHRQLFERGFLLNVLPVGNLLRLDPALTTEEELLAAFLAALDDLLAPQSA